MDAFERELMKRSPLAGAVLEISDFVFDDALLASVWDKHRGRCYEDVLKFPQLLRLMRDALVRHGGSAHKLYLELEEDKAQPVDESNFYRKLQHLPVALSRALLSEGTQRLTQLMPLAAAVTLPSCFDNFRVIIGDGKKIKDAAKRLAPTRGFRGALIGAKALVALDVRSGLALAMNDSVDGMTNDVPLVPGLMDQLRKLIPAAMLTIWDRQFDDVGTMRHLLAREHDAFIVRAKQKQAYFTAETSTESFDEKGQRVLDEIGVLGQKKKTLRVRKITLFRTGEDEEDVVLLTNLMDQKLYGAADVLGLYRHRWGIEQVFQQITETLSLSHLIGCKPQAVLFQFSYCLLLYNLMQVIKTYVAEDGKVLVKQVSLFYLFDNVRKELTAWACHVKSDWPRQQRDAEQMRVRLGALLKGSWNPIRYGKASDKKPRPKPNPKPLLHGGHTSVQRLLEGKVRLAEK